MTILRRVWEALAPPTDPDWHPVTYVPFNIHETSAIPTPRDPS